MNSGIFKEESWAKLERPERLKNLNPYQTLMDLGLKSGDRFADFGSGTGVFVVPALRIVGAMGQVYAVERSQALIGRMLDALADIPENLTVHQLDLMDMDWKDEPVNMGLLCHVAHELPDLGVFLTAAGDAFISGGKLCVIEWCVKEQPQGPPLHKRISPEVLDSILESSGWQPESTVLLGEDYYMTTAVKR